MAGQGDIPTATWSSCLYCQTLMFVNWGPTFPGRLQQQRSGMEFLSGRHVAQECLKADTAAHRQIKQAVWTVYCRDPAVMITGFLTADVPLLCRSTFLPKTLLCIRISHASGSVRLNYCQHAKMLTKAMLMFSKYNIYYF